MPNRTRPIRSVLWGITLLCVSSLSGCIINAGSHVQTRGHVVSRQTLAQIEPGKKKDFVFALIGEPTTKTALEDGTEIWKWTFTEKRARNSSLLFVFDTDDTEEREGATYVQFEGGVVSKAWQD